MMHEDSPPLPGPQDFEWTPPPFAGARMYAIAFELNLDALRTTYRQPLSQAFAAIKQILRNHGFKWQLRNVFFGDAEKINAVTCVLAALDLARSLPWFADSVRTVRMLRVEEQDNLLPAVRQASARDSEGMCLADAGSIPVRKSPAALPSDQIMEM